MGHGEGKELPEVYNLAVKKTQQYPFCRPLRRIGTNSHYVIVPADYVNELKLKPGQKYQFYLEVAGATKAPGFKVDGINCTNCGFCMACKECRCETSEGRCSEVAA